MSRSIVDTPSPEVSVGPGSLHGRCGLRRAPSSSGSRGNLFSSQRSRAGVTPGSASIRGRPLAFHRATFLSGSATVRGPRVCVGSLEFRARFRPIVLAVRNSYYVNWERSGGLLAELR